MSIIFLKLIDKKVDLQYNKDNRNGYFKKGCDKMVSKLKMKRIEKGVKQKTLAQIVGITPQYLMNLESGKSKNPSIKVMKALSEHLNCSVQELFFDEAAATANENQNQGFRG